LEQNGNKWIDMAQRRILSLWFPRLAVERLLRQRRPTLPMCLAIVADQGGAQVLVSLNPEAEAAGLRTGQPLRDATAMCPALVTHPAEPAREAAFLTVLRRWAGKFSPWVAEEAPDGLMVDLTGCAHLFGGEAALLEVVAEDCADLGLTVRAAVADTAGAAWALARHAGRVTAPSRTGDAIEQEAHATRSRAVKRRNWERGGAAPALSGEGKSARPAGLIAPVGRLREALAGLPLAALRLSPETVEGLHRLGLRRIDELAGLPRGALTRRFGAEVLHRLDQAMGIVPEPITPARAPLHFATRLTLPDPVGLLSDLEAGMDRLLPPLCARLQAARRGARRVRLQAFRTDGVLCEVEVGLARAAANPDRIRPLLLMKLPQIDVGFGIDCLRLVAVETEPVHALQHRGQPPPGPWPARRQIPRWMTLSPGLGSSLAAKRWCACTLPKATSPRSRPPFMLQPGARPGLRAGPAPERRARCCYCAPSGWMPPRIRCPPPAFAGAGAI
jgi:protein ImuB